MSDSQEKKSSFILRIVLKLWKTSLRNKKFKTGYLISFTYSTKTMMSWPEDYGLRYSTADSRYLSPLKKSIIDSNCLTKIAMMKTDKLRNTKDQSWKHCKVKYNWQDKKLTSVLLVNHYWRKMNRYVTSVPYWEFMIATTEHT